MISDRLGRFVESVRKYFQGAPRRLVGLSLLRIGLGVAALVTYIGDWAYRRELYGDEGLVGIFGIARHGRGALGGTVFALADNPTLFDLLYVLGILVSLLFAVFGGRVFAVLQLVLISSLHTQNPFILDGGDNLTLIVLLFLPFTVSSAHFSPLASRTQRRLSSGLATAERTLHNTATSIIVTQICIVYLVASMWKIAGFEWQHGIAMERIARTSSYGLTGEVGTLLSIPLVAVTVTWFVMGIQLALPIAVIVRSRLLAYVVGAVILMHFGIVLQLGLVTFGITMIAADCVLLGDAHYERVRHWFEGRMSRRVGLSPAKSTT